MGRANSDQGIRPGEKGRLLHQVADELTARGVAVGRVDEEPEYLTMTDANGMRCDLEVTDWGQIEWQCSLPAPGQIDPKQIADLASVLLTGQRDGFPRLGDAYAKKGMTSRRRSLNPVYPHVSHLTQPQPEPCVSVAVHQAS